MRACRRHGASGACGETLPFPETEAPQRAAARKALDLDDGLSAAHVAWGNVKAIRDWDWAAAESEFRRAIDLDPGNLEARHLYAVLLMALGRHAGAIAEMKHAEGIDPMSSIIQSGFGRVLYRARRYDDAIPHLQRAIDLDAHNFGAYGRLADVYEQQGKLDDAISMNQKADQLRQGSMAVRYSPALARLFARSGRRREALAMMEQITREPQAITRAMEIAGAYVESWRQGSGVRMAESRRRRACLNHLHQDRAEAGQPARRSALAGAPAATKPDAIRMQDASGDESWLLSDSDRGDTSGMSTRSHRVRCQRGS